MLTECTFLQPSLHYLGHLFSAGRISVAPRLSRSLREMNSFDDKEEVRSFVGNVHFCRDNVRGYSSIHSTLRTWMKRGDGQVATPSPNRKVWKCLERISESFTLSSPLSTPRFGQEWLIDIDSVEGDACHLIATLWQRRGTGDSAPWSLVGYRSRALKRSEVSLSQSERDCLSVVWVLQLIRPFFCGQCVTVRTPRDPGTWMVSVDGAS